MNLFQRAKDRANAVIAAVVAAVLFCCCGAVMTFYLSPRQALEANRIANLPQMDAGFVIDASPGDDILISGFLSDNPLLFEDAEFVAYQLDQWVVTLPDEESESTTNSGKWDRIEFEAPALNVEVMGVAFEILASENVRFSGRLQEEIIPGEGPESAKDGSEDVMDGTLRYKGFFNDDVVTVLGIKGSSGGIVPEHLYGGDRVEFEQNQEDAARGLLISGIVLLACAPVVLLGGIVAALFGRRRRSLV